MNSKVIWSNILDETYSCYVLEQLPTVGYLRMERLDTGDTVLDLEVPISKYFRSYDILDWGDICIARASTL